ncbi:MAG: DUF6691 family protein [Bacteroidota bacterium]
MKLIKYFVVGVLFGIVMTKSEAISWFRIQEMFRFESFHMYGIIGTAVVGGAILLAILKRVQLKSLEGADLRLSPKQWSVTRYLAGGTLFGFGWAMTGACPGPLFTLLGHGVVTIGVVILSAILGTFVYGLLRERLPH